MQLELPSARIARLLGDERGRPAKWQYSPGAPLGPLAVIFVADEWFVLHTASGGRVGGVCRSGTTAVLFVGALLGMNVDWSQRVPAFSQAECDAAQARIEALV
jgi:hypothetical protein